MNTNAVNLTRNQGLEDRILQSGNESPIGLEPLTTGVKLLPCLHKVNECEAVQLLYGPQVSVNPSSVAYCPVCREKITGFDRDQTTRENVQRMIDEAAQNREEEKVESNEQGSSSSGSCNPKIYPWMLPDLSSTYRGLPAFVGSATVEEDFSNVHLDSAEYDPLLVSLDLVRQGDSWLLNLSFKNEVGLKQYDDWWNLSPGLKEGTNVSLTDRENITRVLLELVEDFPTIDIEIRQAINDILLNEESISSECTMPGEKEEVTPQPKEILPEVHTSPAPRAEPVIAAAPIAPQPALVIGSSTLTSFTQ